MDLERNKRIAEILGWTVVEDCYDGFHTRYVWKAPDGTLHRELPDFCGDDSAAVKYLLPWIRAAGTVEVMCFSLVQRVKCVLSDPNLGSIITYVERESVADALASCVEQVAEKEKSRE